MSHTGVDVIDFLLLATWPAIALLAIELLRRATHFANWIKLAAQAITVIAFAIAYITVLPTPHWLTSIVLIALGVALAYQSRRAAFDPSRVSY